MPDQIKVNLVEPISDELLSKMIAQIKPLAHVDTGGVFPFAILDTSNTDPRKQSFQWEPKYLRLARIPVPHLRRCPQIVTFHTCGYHGWFKPSLAEVMSSINRFVEDWSKVKYFFLHGSVAVLPDGTHQWCQCALVEDEDTPEQHSSVMREKFDKENRNFRFDNSSKFLKSL